MARLCAFHYSLSCVAKWHEKSGEVDHFKKTDLDMYTHFGLEQVRAVRVYCSECTPPGSESFELLHAYVSCWKQACL